MGARVKMTDKGYKFKIEYVDVMDDEENDGGKIIFTAYGDTAKDTVHSIDEIREEWYKFIEKWGDKRIKTIDDKKDLA